MKTKEKKDILNNSIIGGIFGATTIFILTILGKFNLIGINFLLDIYSNFGYDISFFGIILGIVYGFLTGAILFGLYSLIYNLMPMKH